MITVKKADELLSKEIKDYGNVTLPFDKTSGRILAAPMMADRDIPPYHRVTMDGIAIRFEEFKKGTRLFKIVATQAAGEEPKQVVNNTDCIEIMTGCALPSTVDTVIRYEDLKIENGYAQVGDTNVVLGQNIQRKGIDKSRGEILVPEGTFITPSVIATAASVGCTDLSVKRFPTVAIISTGNELVAPQQKPLPYQIRTSNAFAIQATLQQYGMTADLIHLRDDEQIIKSSLKDCLNQYEVLIISGGVSAGKFDYVPDALQKLNVVSLFHKIAQRPGKPFWFGKSADGRLVFAFPGNPVSTFLCCVRYFIPWLRACMGAIGAKIQMAILDSDLSFAPHLQYFIPVKIETNDEAQIIAKPVTGNSSGDYIQLLHASAFMELPMDQQEFKKRDRYQIWPFNNVLL